MKPLEFRRVGCALALAEILGAAVQGGEHGPANPRLEGRRSRGGERARSGVPTVRVGSRGRPPRPCAVR